MSAILVLAGVGYLFLSRPGVAIRALPAEVEVCSGDILLLGSSTIRGRILKCIDGGTMWAHVGIADASGGVVSIIHADPSAGMVISETLERYLADNSVDSMMVLRPYSGDGGKAAAYARTKAEQKVKFDNTFRYRGGDGLYCTELVLMAWESVGVVILSVERGDSVMPSELESAPRLKVVWSSRNSS